MHPEEELDEEDDELEDELELEEEDELDEELEDELEEDVVVVDRHPISIEQSAGLVGLQHLGTFDVLQVKEE